MDEVRLVARLILAGVFAVAGAAKLADLPGTRDSVSAFGAPGRLVGPLAILLPLAELATAAVLVPAATAGAGATAALILLLVLSAGIAAGIARGEAPDCRCFGRLRSEPVGPSTLARNFGLALLAAVVVV